MNNNRLCQHQLKELHFTLMPVHPFPGSVSYKQQKHIPLSSLSAVQACQQLFECILYSFQHTTYENIF